MKLSEKQKLFMRLLPRLLDYIHEQGFDCTIGDAYRDARAFGAVGEFKTYGNKNSCHKLRLAVDINLFKGGAYLQTTLAHKPIGEFWESMHELCAWGGRFNDGNHYSLKHDGAQ